MQAKTHIAIIMATAIKSCFNQVHELNLAQIPSDLQEVSSGAVRCKNLSLFSKFLDIRRHPTTLIAKQASWFV